MPGALQDATAKHQKAEVRWHAAKRSLEQAVDDLQRKERELTVLAANLRDTRPLSSWACGPPNGIIMSGGVERLSVGPTHADVCYTPGIANDGGERQRSCLSKEVFVV